jgi:O-antigen/teichoic acid export membrane protein
MSARVEIAKNNVIYTAGSIAAAGLSFVFSIIIANMLQPEQFGLFSFALVVSAFFNIFVDLGISSTLIKFMSECLEKGARSRVRSLVGFFFRLRASTALAIGILMAAFSTQIATFIFNKPGSEIFILLAAGLLISNSLFNFVNMVLMGFKNFGYVTALRILERVFRLAFAPALVLLGFSGAGASAGVIMGFVGVVLVGWAMLRKYDNVLKSRGPGFKKWKMAGFGFWALVGSIILNVYNMTDSLIVSMIRPVEDVGFYSIGASWMTLITYLIPVSYIVMYPYFSSFDAKKCFEALKSSLKYVLMPALPLSFIMSAFAPQIISFFYGSPFAPAASALSVLSFVAVVMTISQILLVYFYGIGKPKLHSVVIFAMLVGNVGLTFLLTSTYGILGAAVSMFASRFFEVALLSAVACVVMRAGLGWKWMAKPVVSSIIIYMAALQLAPPTIIHLIVYGVMLLAAYAALMFAMGGVDKNDIKTVFGWLRPLLKI